MGNSAIVCLEHGRKRSGPWGLGFRLPLASPIVFLGLGLGRAGGAAPVEWMPSDPAEEAEDLIPDCCSEVSDYRAALSPDTRSVVSS